MILNNEERECIVESLSWMIEDMKAKHDDLKGNLEEGSRGDYSPQLKEAMGLLEDIKEVETIETSRHHRRALLVNCREFKCVSNRSGVCALSKITLESMSNVLIGKVRCAQAGESKEEEDSRSKTLKSEISSKVRICRGNDLESKPDVLNQSF